MTIDDVPGIILAIATKHGLNLLGPARLTDVGGGKLALIRSKEITPYGEKLVAFALEVQQEGAK